MLTWTEKKTKFQRLARDTTNATLVQGEQDMNTGYHMFNARFGRYYSRKQQFTDVVANQSIYQTPIDSIRIIGMTVKTSTGSGSYSPPIKEIRSEYEWRLIKTNPTYSSSWITYYFVLGNDEIEVWPVPATSITNGIRFYYQPQDHDQSVDDIVSSALTPVQTCTMVNGDVTVTSTGSTFTSQLAGLGFQLTGVTDLTWYEIVSVPTAPVLTLKSPFVGLSGAGLNFRIGQLSILPNEYQDVDIHYALGLYFYGKGNTQRGDYHLGRDEDGKRGLFWSAIQSAIQAYSSSTQSNVITDSDNFVSPWLLTPLPGIIP